MKSLAKWVSVLVVLWGFVSVSQAHALQVVNTDDLQLSVGGLIQVMGETAYVSDDTFSNKVRFFLWNVGDSLYASGGYKGFNWRIGTIYGGTTNAASATNSNGFLDLTDAYVDIPLIGKGLYLKAGQFKDPTNLESATDGSYMLFTEKSPNFNLFFNSGYEMGLVLAGSVANFDAVFGLVQGVPSLPQRFIPEKLNLPLPMLLRIGYSSGISDDPFHPRQMGFAKVEDFQFGVHLNGFVAADSNAGHGTLFSQMGSGLKTFLYNQDYSGNILLSSVFNPYLGYQKAEEPANGLYYQTGLDFQVRAPLGSGMTVALSGQAAMGHFQTTVQSGDTTGTILGVSTATLGGNSYALNIFGGVLTASLQNPTWALALRLAVVLPDSALQGTWTTGTYAPIFANTNPVWEVTPSVTFAFSQYVKLTAEAMLMFNEPESVDKDGNYIVAEMPGLAAGTAYAGPNISAAFVPIGRLLLQASF